MPQITVTQTSPLGQVEQLSRDLEGKAPPVRVHAKPGSTIEIRIDGQVQTGKEVVGGERPRLRRVGKDMIVELDGKPILEVSDYYVENGSNLIGNDWTYATDQASAIDGMARLWGRLKGGDAGRGGAKAGGGLPGFLPPACAPLSSPSSPG